MQNLLHPQTLHCAAKDARTLKNYWILPCLHDRDFHIVGETVVRYFLDFEDEKHNLEVLLKSLNSFPLKSGIGCLPVVKMESQR